MTREEPTGHTSSASRELELEAERAEHAGNVARRTLEQHADDIIARARKLEERLDALHELVRGLR